MVLNFDPRQLEARYRKHARDFGLTEPFNEASARRFRDLLEAHLNAPTTLTIRGTYRTTITVVHHLDPATGINGLSDLHGNFISAWKLNPDQIRNVLSRGSL